MNNFSWKMSLGQLCSTSIKRKVKLEEYSFFQKELILYILQGKRYGQAFCEHFDLEDTIILYHLKDPQICERWIQENYL